MAPIEVLRTGLFGYEKSGVKKYIDHLRKEYQDRIIQDEMEHEEAISQLRKQLAALQQEKEEGLKKLEQAERQVASLEQEKKELDDQLEKLKPAQIRAEQLRTALEEMNEKIADILAQDKGDSVSRNTQGKIYEFEAR